MGVSGAAIVAGYERIGRNEICGFCRHSRAGGSPVSLPFPSKNKSLGSRLRGNDDPGHQTASTPVAVVPSSRCSDNNPITTASATYAPANCNITMRGNPSSIHGR
jgi:hypothetical protein